MKTPRILTLGVVAGALAGSMVFAVAAPANASTYDPFDLLQYVQTVKSSQLQAASTIGGTYPGAWSATQARITAASASGYNVQQLYGVQAATDIAEVIPINNPVDTTSGTGKKLPNNGGAGRKLPAFGADKFRKAVGGVGGATVALTAFMFRAEIADGVLSWVGIDGNDGAVCGADLGGFVNFVTGQDCAAWAANEEYEANSGIEYGITGGQICGNGGEYGTVCYTLKGLVSSVTNGQPNNRWVFDATSTVYNFTSQQTFAYRSEPGGQWRTSDSHSQSLYYDSSPSGASYPTVHLASYYNGRAHSDVIYEYTVRYNGVYGAPMQAVETDIDPDRYLQCRVFGEGGAALTANTGSFKESDAQWPEPNCPALPGGATPSKVEVWQYGGGDPVKIWEQEPTPAQIEYDRDFAELCNAKTCLLDLIQLSSGLSCFGMGAACDGWMTSPTRDADYGCAYGGVAQPIQECHVYANVFNVQKRLAGNAYADPETGADVGGSTSLRYDESLMGSPARTPEQIRGCGGSGWGEPNPLQWVLKPVQCALEWAFVPSQMPMRLATIKMQDAWEETTPGAYARAVSLWSFSFPTGSCGGVPYVFTYKEAVIDMGIPSACAGSPYAPFAGTIKMLSGFGFVIGGVVALKRAAGSAIGFNSGG